MACKKLVLHTECLHELIDATAERLPRSIAVVYENYQLTYGELYTRTNRLANYLRKVGVEKETLVGLCIERSVDMVVSAIAIQKAGGAYVPIDPSFPPERIELVLNDANANVLLTEEKQRELLQATPSKKVYIDSNWQEIFGEKANVQNSDVGPHNLAYVMYTSGSTGKPKGVQIEHHSVVNFLGSMRKIPGLGQQDTLLAVTTLSFDISVLEQYLPLTTGAKLVILPDEKTADGPALIKAVDGNNITVMQATPATWRLMLESGWKGKSDLKVLCGGEPMPSDLARELIPKCGELWNMYGPTETTIWSTCARITDPRSINIGKPIDNTDIYILDDKLKPQPIGVEGELAIGGKGLARGYNNLPELTNQKFIPHPLKKGDRIYRTGDIAQVLGDGAIECYGRMDDQIKLHGFRIELGEIETILAGFEDINRAVAVLREDQPGDKRLVAYYTGGKEIPQDTLRRYMLSKLPEYMSPSIYVRVDKFPLTPNGKTDRKALPAPQKKRPLLANEYIAPRSDLEKKLAACWRDVLDIDDIGINDSFFDLGGTSLLAARMVNRWGKNNEHDIPLVKLFQYHTISLLTNWMLRQNKDDNFVQVSEQRVVKMMNEKGTASAQTPIAVIGIAGRFPGADNLDILWSNLCSDVESISIFHRDELGIGIDESLRYDPDYIPARGIIAGAEYFDAAFFGISPLEASVMDPQQRVFLELAYEALENAGYDPDRSPGPIGVYAGTGDNHYYSINLLSNPDIIKLAGNLVVEYGNEKDYLSLRVAYALGLNGPALSANTACSTSLVAVDNAVQGLSNYDCDLALAGGVDICVPQKSGFLYLEGGVFAKDGHCKPFDADATGTMFCDGAGLVVLKRLDDAIADRDTIYAVICGSAKNSNGSRPASFLAPSVEGQAEVIALAQARAGIPVETIGYIEGHGTGTPIGDPIEIEALTKVFSAKTQKKQFCHIGSIKGHIGHPTNAAGIAGFIKAALVLHKEQIPPTLHYKKPNPKIDFTNSPFKPVETLVPFPRSEVTRRTAVSSFGFGGTNAHAILEEAPLVRPGSPSRAMQLITVSAKTESALDAYCKKLSDHFVSEKPSNFPDAAFTLIQGRKQLAHRKIVVASDPAEAADYLIQRNISRTAKGLCTRQNPGVVFLFGGQGTQYVNMGLNLYQDEPLFRATIDECCEILRPYLDENLHDVLYPSPNNHESAKKALINTCFTQPAIFTIEYAFARLWQSLGVEPSMMAGHSIGEFVAATIAGVFELRDALKIAAHRGRLMQSMPTGSMLSVRADASKISSGLPQGVQIAAINAPSLCVLSGPDEKIREVQEIFESKEITCRRLQTSHAFHSEMMEPILDSLRELIKTIQLSSPSKPFISTVTGLPITDAQACDPEYWVMHARKTVCFSSAMTWLVENGHSIYIECGPRATMCTLARQHMQPDKAFKALPSLNHSSDDSSDWESFLMALGSLWIEGVDIYWDVFYAHEQRRRIPLPTYPFERKRYWVDPVPITTQRHDMSTPYHNHLSEMEAPPRNDNDSIDKIIPDSPSNEKVSGLENIKFRLLRILASVLGCDPDQLDESVSFMDQGFDSLSLTQVSRSIRNEFKVKVTFGQLADELPTVETLSGYIQNHLPEPLYDQDSVAKQQNKTIAPNGKAESIDSSDEISQLRAQLQELTKQFNVLNNRLSPESLNQNQPRPHPSNEQQIERLPLTDPQREIWLSCYLFEGASRAYNESFVIRLSGDVDKDILEASLQELLSRHDALRTKFSKVEEFQFIHPYVQTSLTYNDLSNYNDIEREKTLSKLIADQNRTFFNLVKGPLLCFQLIKMSTGIHIFHVTYHHISMDGWSAHILMMEIGKIYNSKISGIKHDLPHSMQYQKYIDWYFHSQSVADRNESEQHFVNIFRDLPPAVELPSDQLRQSQRTYRSDQSSITFDQEIYKKIKQTCLKLNCTFFQFLFASFNVWLYRLTNISEITIGVPIAGHVSSSLAERNETDNLVGHCVNLVPIRLSLNSEMIFPDIVNAVKKKFIEARTHENLSYSKLIEKLNPPRHPGQSPLVSITFNLSDDPILDWGELEAEPEWPPKPFIFFDLMINIRESHDKAVVALDFSTDLFKQSTIGRWLAQWERIIEGFLSTPEIEINRVPFISRDEAQTLLIDWNRTSTDYPSDKSLHHLFEEQVTRTPDAVAAQFGTETLTFHELNNRANKLANYLISIGEGPNNFIGVCVERSLEMLISLLGILKTGNAYLPLDPDYPTDRLQYMIEDSGATVVITQSSLKQFLPLPKGVRTICIDDDKEAIAQCPQETPETVGRPDNSAYIIYTSGSTGKPKGVRVPHRAVVNLLFSMSREPGMKETDVLLAVTTLSFDIHVLEIFTPLITGARVVVADRETTSDGNLLLNLLNQSQATIMQATPSTWRLLLEAGWSGSQNLKILCGGEAFPKDLLVKLLSRADSVWNMYGPTETTVWSSCYQLTNADKPILVGRPISNTQIYILDRLMQPVPIGVPGELCIGGDGVALGYLNRPEMTEKQFVPDPFRSVQGARIYKTGDLARFHPDGNIECLGRIDTQVKIRGFRIELGEIENVLSSHPSVDKCAATVREDTPGDIDLVGYIVSKVNNSMNVASLKNHLRVKLPEYMIPRLFVNLDAMPLTPAGKVDRKNLPAPEKNRSNLELPYVAPGSDFEKAITSIWQDVLKIEKIGINDDFFELGGSSLTALRVFAKIEDIFGKKIPLATLLKAPTIEKLAMIVRQDDKSSSWKSLVTFQDTGSNPPIFLVHGAEGNILLYRELAHHLGPDQPVYGLQSQGLDGSEIKYTQIDEIAANYISEIQTIQPEGPYYLGGYCLGGVISYEMAQQLSSQGYKVNLVAMIETYNPQLDIRPTSLFQKSYYTLQNLSFHIQNYFKLNRKDKYLFLYKKAFVQLGRIKKGISAGLLIIAHSISAKKGKTEPKITLKKVNDQAYFDYKPKAYPGRLTLFLPQKFFSGTDDPHFGWKELAKGGLDVFKFPINPKGMLYEPFVQSLAEKLTSCIQEFTMNETSNKNQFN